MWTLIVTIVYAGMVATPSYISVQNFSSEDVCRKMAPAIMDVLEQQATSRDFRVRATQGICIQVQ